MIAINSKNGKFEYTTQDYSNFINSVFGNLVKPNPDINDLLKYKNRIKKAD